LCGALAEKTNKITGEICDVLCVVVGIREFIKIINELVVVSGCLEYTIYTVYTGLILILSTIVNCWISVNTMITVMPPSPMLLSHPSLVLKV